jgi:hypothetical protein
LLLVTIKSATTKMENINSIMFAIPAWDLMIMACVAPGNTTHLNHTKRCSGLSESNKISR